jgi:2-methylcitrate dehydratase PrpD
VGAVTGPSAQAEDAALWPFLSALTVDQLPAETRESLVAVVLDHLTCAVLGMDLPWTQTVRAIYDDFEALPPGQSHLGPAVRYGSTQPISTRTACVVNGTAAHGLDLDDLYLPAMTHPAAVIISAAVAVAGALESDGRDVLAAIAAGYEVMGRVGRAVGARNVDHGFHATAQQGPIGAAVAVGRLLGFDARQLENAVGLAVSMGAGIKAFTAGPGMVKRLHAGRAAEAGLLAAHATVRGFAGPRRPLTSEFGFIHVFALGGPEHPEALTDDLGASWVVDDVYLKPYAACGALHGSIVAAEQVAAQLREKGVRPDDIADVTVSSSRRVIEQNNNPDPQDVMSAQYSAQYAVSLALHGQVRDATRFLTADRGADGEVRKLLDRFRFGVDDRAQAAYPASNEGRVGVRLVDGRTFEAYGVAQSGQSRGWPLAADKFRSSLLGSLPPATVSAVVAGVRDLLDGASVHGFLAPIADALETGRQAGAES